ncbi:hypothetical protein C8J57DRAFT_1725419 [Mycena rebaudengoi]|nr:hypothetical protein C8J57DRAFT_1725419 [Mycena rebaudengoi]
MRSMELQTGFVKTFVAAIELDFEEEMGKQGNSARRPPILSRLALIPEVASGRTLLRSRRIASGLGGPADPCFSGHRHMLVHFPVSIFCRKPIPLFVPVYTPIRVLARNTAPSADLYLARGYASEV